MRALSIDSRYRVVRNLCGRAESTTAGSAGIPTLWPRWYGQGGATGTNSVLTDDAPVGSRSVLRKTWTVAPTGQSNDIAFSVTSGGVNSIPVTAGQVFTVSWYQRRSWDDVVDGVYRSRLEVSRYAQDGSSAGAVIIPVSGNFSPTAAGEWQRVYGTFTVPTGTFKVLPYWSYYTSVIFPVGSTFDATALMLTEGPTLYDYADGNSPSWRWDGTPNASTSRGLVFVP